MKTKSLSVFVFLAAFMIARTVCAAEADAQKQTQTEAEAMQIPETILESDHMPIRDAAELLEGGETDLLQDIRDLQLCEGAYIQEPGPVDTGKTYTATLSFYLKQGEPWLAIEYTGYMGTIEDAPVTRASEDGYSFHAAPKGTFVTQEHTFSIDAAPDKLRISWADMEPRMLYRGSGAAEEVDQTGKDFTKTSAYTTTTETLDKLFGRYDHHYVYDAESRTFSAYVVLKEDARAQMIANAAAMRDSWHEILETSAKTTDVLSQSITIAARDGLYDFTDAHCIITFVDRLNDTDTYLPQDTLAIIQDGTVQYDVLADVLAGSGSAADNTLPELGSGGDTSGYGSGSDSGFGFGPGFGSASGGGIASSAGTLGEKNALQRAKDYLDIMAFSYTGLIDQLEFDGFSYSEAVYAADHCGADWNQQAAKRARSYLEIMSFSRDGLYDQLIFDGFTESEAAYGVSATGY